MSQARLLVPPVAINEHSRAQQKSTVSIAGIHRTTWRASTEDFDLDAKNLSR